MAAIIIVNIVLLVLIVASINIGLIARRLDWKIGLIQGWLVPVVGFILNSAVIFFGDMENKPGQVQSVQLLVTLLVAIGLTTGFVLIRKKIKEQRNLYRH